MSRKLAYVKILFHGSHATEFQLFDGVEGFDVSFVGNAGGKFAKYIESSASTDYIKNAKHVNAEIEKLIPDFLSNLVMRQPPSPVHFVKLKALDSLLQEADIIVSAEVYSYVSRQCAEIAMKAGKKLVVEVWDTIHTLPIHYITPHALNVRAVKKYADLFIVHTDLSKRYLERLGVPEGKIRRVYPGIDLNRFSDKDRSKHENLRILFVGRLYKHKGFSVLLEAFRRLYKTFPQIELWVRAAKHVGEEWDIAEKASEIYPIKIIDYVKFDELPEVYRQCDILCLPSSDLFRWGIKVWEEQFGLVFMEAMACGLPIVSTNCGAIPEVIGPENPVVPQNDPSSLYRALYELIEDDKYRERISRLNRMRSEEFFDIEKQKIKLSKDLQDICQ